jgi:two-component system cell cycle sensor histidine kinase/response regulator CckA
MPDVASALMHPAPFGVLLADRQGRIVELNPAGERLLRRSRAEAVGRDAAELVEAAGRELEVVAAALDGPGAVRAAFYLRDLTHERALEAALADSVAVSATARDRLLQTRHLDLVERLAGGVAHDLNSQLTAIMGYAELTLADRELSEPVRLDVEQVLNAAERADGLTRQLLAFSSQQVLAPRSVELASIVAGTHATRRRLVGRGVELVDRPSPGVAPVLVDPTRLEQTLLDIVANAGEAMPDGGQLITECMMAGRHVRLALTDTGTGMDAETRSRAFEPFFTTKSGHTGLGLSTVHSFAGQSGGHVTLDSEPGIGTTVALYLKPA